MRTAIYAAYILRTMHRRCQDIAQSDRAKMIANADHFENLAVRVYKAAAADDLELAKNCLDCSLEMWTGDHLIDLVVKSGSHDFLEECCTEVLNFRLYGDLDPRTSETKVGLCKLTLGILTLGFLPALFPKFLKWVPPPRCVIHVYIDAYVLREGECAICVCLCVSVPVYFALAQTHTLTILLSLIRRVSMRGKMQRRATPVGWPYNPSRNSVLRKLQESTNFWGSWYRLFTWQSNDDFAKFRKLMELDESQGQDSSTLQSKMQDPATCAALWDPTFSIWQRLNCFFSAPIVLFLTNSLLLVIVTLIFSVVFVELRLSEPAALSLHTLAHTDTLTTTTTNTPAPCAETPPPPPSFVKTTTGWEEWAEWILCGYFICSLHREIVLLQLAVVTQTQKGVLINVFAGLTKYFMHFWNIMDLGSIAGFFMGFLARYGLLGWQWSWSVGFDPPMRACSLLRFPSLSFFLCKHPSKKQTLQQICYAAGVFCCWMRVLRAFYITDLGLIITILFQMIINVSMNVRV